MLKVQNLIFDYPHSTRRTPLLNRISLQVSPGRLLYLQGNNGSGKTTLLQLLARLRDPEAGEIHYADQHQQESLALCFIGCKPGISSALTVLENCLYDPHWPPHTPIEKNILLQTFDLKAYKNTLVCHLSTGQKKRVALLRLLYTPATLWILDEPLLGLDQNSILQLSALFEKHLKNGGSIILSSHQMLPLSPALCDTFYLEDNSEATA
ncbi:MAG: heme ABC exporter ATP-binding protein CcmA [Legionellaceae bacterium]|nr:heme ABC exporter ATP-binding protein CcmA [Legionellaceae bacterium]